jgi:hypothetical protein
MMLGKTARPIAPPSEVLINERRDWIFMSWLFTIYA